MKTPVISICIPVYNGEQYLVECLESVIKQGIEECEIIIVDDGSTDNSVQLITNFQLQNPSAKINLYRNDKNLGLVGNWNKCLELAKGEWIKYVFQDDILAPNCLNKMLAAAVNSNFVVCDRQFIFDKLVPEETKNYYSNKLLRLQSLVNKQEAVFLSNKVISTFTATYIYLNFIGEPTAVLFKKSLVNEVGIFNSNLYQICDLEYWLRIATSKGLVFIPEKLISFRIHANSTTSKNLTGAKNFKANYFDVIILSHELLYNTNFFIFRSFLTYFQKRKIQFFIQLKMHEAKLAFTESKSADPNLFTDLIGKYPNLKKELQTKLPAKIAHQLLVAKRKLINS